VEENGRSYVKHYLIDFASTMGAGANGLNPMNGYEEVVDFSRIGGRLLALGFLEDKWRRVEKKYPPKHLAGSVGYYENEYFEPTDFKSHLPNPAFANLTDADGYWAAKIISAFSDAHLAAIGDAVRAPNPDAVQYLVTQMAERRDNIAHEWFTRVAPIDFFQIEGSWKEGEVVPAVSSEPLEGFVTLKEGGVNARLMARDLGVERGIWTVDETKWRLRCAAVDEERDAEVWSGWQEVEVQQDGAISLSLWEGAPALALATAGAGKRPFLAFEFEVNRGKGWSDPVTTYAGRGSGRIVAVDR
jgi:hypothetical protein